MIFFLLKQDKPLHSYFFIEKFKLFTPMSVYFDADDMIQCVCQISEKMIKASSVGSYLFMYFIYATIISQIFKNMDL